MDDPHDPPQKRTRGRPRVPEPKPGATVATWLPPAEHDRLIKAAHARDMSVSAVVRVWIKKQLKS